MSTATEQINLHELRDTLDRAEAELTEQPAIDAAIFWHETAIMELRQRMPSPLFRFWHFRCEPERHAFCYAENRESAEALLKQRMIDKYQGNWKIASPVVKVYSDPQEASNAAPCNLLTCLSEAEARLFCKHYRQEQKRQHDLNKDKPKIKHLPQSQLERDVLQFELQMRLKDR